MAIGTIWYIRQVLEDQVVPVLPAWIVLSGTLTLSFLTYLTSSNPSFVTNIANFTGAISADAIMVVLYVRTKIRGGTITLSPFQKKCLKAAFWIATLWITFVFLGRTFHPSSVILAQFLQVTPNVLMQIVMIIGYSVMIHKLWHSPKNTDSFVLWVFIGLSCVFGLYTAIMRVDWLAILYALRGGICASITVWAMIRIERRTSKIVTA